KDIPVPTTYIPQNSPEFVPSKHRDYHAQVRTILNDLKQVQSIKEGIKWQFTIDGNKISTVYRLYFPILFFIGDTIEHNKLCGLRGGFSATYICRLCNIPRDKLDTPSNALSAYEQQEIKTAGKRLPSNTYTLTDTRVLLQKRSANPQYVKDVGYYPCEQNILQELQFCDRLGFNVSTPPEVLHAVLLCHGTRSLNAFAKIKKNPASSMSVQSSKSKQYAYNKNIDESSDESIQSNNKNHYVFTGKYKEVVEGSMKLIGYALSRQCDPDRPRSHFPSGYLPSPNKSDDNTSGKKAAHELRGVLLTILFFLLSHNHCSDLEKKMGIQQIASYVHLFELIVLLECWLTREQFTEEELTLADKFLPLFTNTFVSTINRTEGHGTKLIKIHLLHHFVASIRLFGRSNNFHGGTGESHLKPIKDHARRTKYQNHDYEFRTMVKHWEAGVIHSGCLEVLSINPSSLITKHIAALSNKNEHIEGISNRYGSRVYFTVTDGILVIDMTSIERKWKSSLQLQSFIHIIQQLKTCTGFIHTEFNANGVKYHGNFYNQWEDWCFYQQPTNLESCLCQLLLFVTITSKSDNSQKLLLSSSAYIQEEGTYAFVHYTSENVFLSKPKGVLYKVKYNTFLAHEDCSLIRHWAKHTKYQVSHSVEDLFDQEVSPTIGMINVQDIVCPVIGIPDHNNPIPNSYLFAPRRALWPQFFVERMHQLVNGTKNKNK
ncbi:MAG TPA: hypothetical protein VIQ31_07010, partial [Phormidium sp.]